MISNDDLLASACRTTARMFPELQKSLQESPATSEVSIRKEISSFLDAVFLDRMGLQYSASAKLMPLLESFDIALLQTCDMAIFGQAQLNNRRAIIWPNVIMPARPSRNRVFYVIAANLAQTMQAFRLLLIQGFENQARSTLRNIVEIADLMIAVLAYEDVYKDYIQTFEADNDTYKHWASGLKPSKIQNRILDLDNKFPICINLDIKPEDIRKSFYGWLSKFSHNNFVAHVISAYPGETLESYAPMAMLGSVGEISRATLAHGLLYLWVSLAQMHRLLCQQHGWLSFKSSRNRRWFNYRAQIFLKMCDSYLPSFWESEGVRLPETVT